MTESSDRRPRVLLLFTTTGYEAQEFVQVAQQLGVDTVLGSNRCHILPDPWQDGAIPLQFERPQEAAQRLIDYAQTQPLDAVLAIGDTPVLTATLTQQALGLRHNAPEAAAASRNKFLLRQLLRAAGLPTPWFACFPMQREPQTCQHEVPYPCVLKPLALSASRGVIRANNPDEFVTAFYRLRALLATPEIRQKQDPVHDAILVESFIPGVEVALEGLMTDGSLQMLALFDKPDPLDGPFFEETLYVTPSRLPSDVQDAVLQCTAEAAQALGLRHGPVHAELRLNQDGPWILEVAARAIGGL